MAGNGNIRENWVKEQCELKGFEVFRSGWPDFLLFHTKTKTAIFLEVKSNKDSVRLEQKRMHKILKQIGLTVKVVRVGKEGKSIKKLEKAIMLPGGGVELGGEKVTLTHDKIEKGKSRRGGWSQEQLRFFGIDYPLTKGWMARLIGKEIPLEYYKRFLALRDAHLAIK